MAVNQIRLILRGHNGGGNAWSIGLSINGDTSGTSSDYADWIDSIQSDVRGTYNGGTHKWGLVAASDTYFEGIDAYVYNTPGSPATALATHDFSTPLNGAGTHATPHSCAVVCTLLNGLPGRHNRGRLYLPADGATLTNSQLDSSTCTGLANGIKDLIDVINASTPNSAPCNVMVAGPGQTVLNRVSTLRVDSLPDVQRRRQDKVTPAATAVISV